MEGKTALILGVANRWSLAYAIAQAFQREGARLLLTYQGERLQKTVEELGASLGAVRVFDVAPEEFGFERASLGSLRGGDAEANARTVREIIAGERRDAGRSLVVANAAAALFVGGLADDLIEAARLAERSIDEGAALAKLEQLARATRG